MEAGTTAEGADSATPPVVTGQLIAHRGFARCFPENTLVAVESSFVLGAAAVEVDVRLTADSVPVLMHDSTVERTTSGVERVDQLTWMEIRTLDACSWFGAHWNACSVPSLEEVLRAAEGRGKLLIELKPRTTRRTVELVLNVIHNAMNPNVEVVSFNVRDLEWAREIDPNISVGLLVEDSSGLRRLAGLEQATAFFRVDVVAQDSLLVNTARETGLDVGIWTLLRQDELDTAARIGVRRWMADLPLRPR